MKKIGFGIIAGVLLATVYYFAAGSEKLTQEMKIRVNTELNMIEKSGFAIQEREIKAQEEHFVIVVDDPKKIVTFLQKQGSDVTVEDVQSLTGTRIGVDLKYLNDTYSALSADVYPLNFPPSIAKADDLNETDKIFIEALDEMMKRKALLVHMDFNKLLSSFKGYVKDINETIQAEDTFTMEMAGATFEGTIKDDRIETMSQNIKNLTMAIKGESTLYLSLETLKNRYEHSGPSQYDTRSEYSIARLKIMGENKKDSFDADIKGISGSNITEVKEKLASNKIRMDISELSLKNRLGKTAFKQTSFAFNIDKLDMEVLKKLEETDRKDKAATNQLIQALISKGITMEIPLFEVKKLTYKDQEMDGFSLSSFFEINKTADLAAIQANPFEALSAINTKTKITLSDALFALIAQQPQAMMIAMLIQPKVINGKKVYEIELKDGKFSVNGSPLM